MKVIDCFRTNSAASQCTYISYCATRTATGHETGSGDLVYSESVPRFVHQEFI